MKTTIEQIDEIDNAITSALKFLENSVGTTETVIRRKNQEIDKLYAIRRELLSLYNREERGGISIDNLC